MPEIPAVVESAAAPAAKAKPGKQVENPPAPAPQKPGTAPKRLAVAETVRPKAILKRGATSKPRARDPRITVFVARGGPMRGDADYELAFPNRHQALAFLSNQHGLTIEEQRQLARASRLKLNRRWHGSEACVLREVALDPDQAARVLQGESAAA